MLLNNTLTNYCKSTNKSPTGYMLESLMDIHERELLKLEPPDAGMVRFSKGLISRGLLRCDYFITASGKRIMALFVTEAGRKFLSLII
ncbi:MAG: hypothetical protein M3004_10120 [Bacteroidota bacterium]|nr:hypothetical protein [Bacteroidota bacterium]